MEKIREKIWKGSKPVALNAVEMAGGCAILSYPNVVDLTEWHATQFVLIASFRHLSSGSKGSLMNIYGPSAFPKKHAFLDFLEWVKVLSESRNWVIGGDFNLISNLGKNKGGRRSLDKF